MEIRKDLSLVLISGVIPFLIGFGSASENLYEFCLSSFNLSNFQIQLIDGISKLAFGIGILISGFLVDKNNIERQHIVLFPVLIIFGVIILFVDNYILILFQRAIVGYVLGYFLMYFQVRLIELLQPNHRGKLIVLFYSLTTIGSISVYLITGLILSDKAHELMRYGWIQIPFTLLPLLILFKKQILFEKNMIDFVSLKEFFTLRKRYLWCIMIGFSILCGLASPGFQLFNNMRLVNPALGQLPTLISLIAVILAFAIIDLFDRRKLVLFGSVLILIYLPFSFLLNKIISSNILLFISNNIYVFLFTLFVSAIYKFLVLESLPHNLRGRGMVIFGVILGIARLINTKLINVYIDINNGMLYDTIHLMVVYVWGYILLRKYYTGLVRDKQIEISDDYVA